MFKTPLLTSAALGAVLTSLLPAQTSAQPSANRFIPENSALVVRIASPAKWRKQFGQTQVAKLGEADALAPYMGMIRQRMDMSLEMLRDSGMFDADLVEGLLNTWQGDIIFSVQVDWDGLIDAMDFGETPPMSYVLALTPDGNFDLAAVAKEMDRAIEAEDSDGTLFRELAVGDLTMRYMGARGQAPDVAVPLMIDGHLVMLGSNQLEKDASKLIANEARFTSKSDAPFYMHADLGRALKTVFSAGTENAPFDMAGVIETIGLGSIEGLTLTMRAEGKAVAGDLRIGMKKQGRGLMNMMVNSSQRPKLLGSIPANSEAFSVSSMDFAPIYKTIRETWGMLEDMVPMTFEDAMGTFTEATKVRLKEDLIDNLGNEMLAIQDVAALKNMDPDDMEDLEDNPAAMLSGSVYGMALRDGEAFGAALEKMMRSRGMHVGRKTETYANVDVHRMKVAGLVELEYVVTKDLLLLNLGGKEGTARILRDILDTRAAGDAKGPAILAKRGAELAPGWNGISMTPIGAMLENAMKGLQASGQFGEEMDMATQIVSGLVADMNRLNIGSMLQASYCDDNGLAVTFRW